MKRIIKSKVFLVCLTFSIVGFILSQSIVYPKLNKVESILFNSVSNGICDATFRVELQNDNWFSYQSNDLNTEVYYKDRLIAVGVSQSISLIRKSSQIFDLNTIIFLDSLNKDLYNFLSKDSIDLKIKITGKFTFLRIKKSIELKTKISSEDFVSNMINDLMQDDGVKINNIQLKNINGNNSTFDLSVIFKNKLPFDVILSKFYISVYSDANFISEVANWSIDMNKLIPKNSYELINGSATINNINASLSGVLKVFTGDFDYYCKGTAEVNVDNYKIKIPLKLKFKFNPISKEIFIEN